MNHRLQALVAKIIGLENSPTKLAAACALGIFWACSPFLGIQTIFAMGSAWLLGLNLTVVVLVLYTVNNPFTMIPIIIIDYWVGYYIFKVLLHCSVDCLPPWLDSIDRYVRSKIAHWFPQFSFFYYFAGGMIFAVACGLISYFCISRWLKRYFRYT